MIRALHRSLSAALALSALLTFAPMSLADEIRYRVEPGDTLIGLGQALLADPRDWSRVQRLNDVADPFRIPVGSVLRIPVAWLKPVPRSAEVVTSAGDVKADGKALEPGMRVGAGVTLTTGEDGHLVLRLPDGSTLILPARSAARVEVLNGFRGTEDQDVRLKLERGRVEAQAAPQRGPAARFRVDTPTAVIGVRGTEFRVGADPELDLSRAEVTEGRVGVSRADASSRTRRERGLEQGFGMVARAGAALPEPVRLLPAPTTAAIPVLFEEPLLRFSLPEMPGAQAWRVQIAERHADAPVLANQVLTSGPVRIPGLPDADYRLVLRAIDGDGLEGLDAKHEFRLKARPVPPFLSTPAAGGKVVTGAVAFTWSQAPDAATYRIEVAQGEGFDTPVAKSDALKDSRFTAELLPGRYRWRMASVRADGDRGPWSAAAAFEVRPVPAAPEPPAIGDKNLEFRWSGEPGQRFDYQFASDEAFATVLADASVSEPHISLPVPDSGSYWMRVRAIDPDGFVSPWSPAQKVVIPAGFPWWMLLFPLLIL